MGLPQWTKLDASVPLGALVGKLNDFLRSIAKQIDGGERAAAGLTSATGDPAGGRLRSGVEPAADIAGSNAGIVGKVQSSAFSEPFNAAPADDQWDTIAGALNTALVATGVMGGKALRQTGAVTLRYKFNVAFDPSKLYRLRVRASRVSGTPSLSFGLACYSASDTLLGVVYAAASNSAPATGTYTLFTGWVQGTGTPHATLPEDDATDPTPLYTGTVAVRPQFAVGSGGVMDLDSLDFDKLDEDTNARVKTSLIPADASHPDYDPRYATGARLVPDAADTDAIQTDVEIVGRIENADASSFIDLRTTLAPGATIVQLPGYTADNLGNATFDGTVAAERFTGNDAEFASLVRIGVADPTTGVLAIYDNVAGDDVFLLRTRSIGGIPAIAASIEAGVYPVHISGSVIRIGGSPTMVSTAAVEVTGTLDVSGAAAVGSLASSGAVSGTTGTFSSSVSASAFTTGGSVSGSVGAFGSASVSGTATVGAVSIGGSGITITGSRTTDVASILDQIIDALAARGFNIANGTTP